MQAENFALLEIYNIMFSFHYYSLRGTQVLVYGGVFFLISQHLSCYLQLIKGEDILAKKEKRAPCHFKTSAFLTGVSGLKVELFWLSHLPEWFFPGILHYNVPSH